MKNIFLVISLFMIAGACGPTDRDSVRQAHTQNLNSSIDEDVSDFLTGAADATMMDIELGKMAMNSATSANLRVYAQGLIQDQTDMLTKLRVLAASKNIVLPHTVGHENARTLERLKAENGEDFDRKFAELLRERQREVLDEFEDAGDLRDPDIRSYAEAHYEVLKSQASKSERLDAAGAEPAEDQK